MKDSLPMTTTEHSLGPLAEPSELRRMLINLPFRVIPRWLGRTSLGARFLVFTPASSVARSVVGRSTDICIEGQPRSATTFTYAAVSVANPGLQVSGQTHLEGNVLLAVKRGVPTVVSVREPLAAMASWREFSMLREPARRLLIDYARFYESVLAIPDGSPVVICRFEDLISSPRAATLICKSSTRY